MDRRPSSGFAKATVSNALGETTREALRKSESRYRRLFEAARDGILLLNSDTGQIEDVNPYLVEMLGYSHAEFLGKKLWEVGAFADIAQSKEMFVVLQERGYVRYDDLPLKTSSGERIAVEFVSNSYDCDGIKVIQCNIRDITARNAARKRAEGELRILSRAVEQSAASIVITDPEGTIDYVNPRFEIVTGYTKAESVGENPRILQSGETPAETYRELWHAISEQGEWHGELCNRRKNGELFWEFVQISGLRNEYGEIDQYVAVKEDISNRKIAEHALRESERSLLESQEVGHIGSYVLDLAADT